jgi:predicted NUDIX family phosphoesterase
MSAVQTEQVMVVKTELFHELGCFQGFCSDTQRYLETLLDPANTQYRPRSEMEQDPGFKQLIPYCVFEHVDEAENVHVFHYRRGSGSGESRLRQLQSVGIGGHISSTDANDHSPYEVGMQRELDEEIEIRSPYESQLAGLINDDSNDVGQVHLGIVHRIRIQRPDIKPREVDIADAGFTSVARLLTELDGFETWSQICLQSLYGQG